MTARVGWLDVTGGVSGDMLLGACFDAGAPREIVQDSVDSLGLPEDVIVRSSRTNRSGIDACRALVDVGHAHHHRTLPDVLEILEPLAKPLRDNAAAVFETLAEAEARVHGIPPDRVHFHEVGALDSIADVVGVVTALDALGLDRLTCSHIGLGGGRASMAHGQIPIPGPAVLELLRAAALPGVGGPINIELATPTGVALLAVLAEESGPMPALIPEVIGTGAGTADPAGHPNVVRLVIGRAATARQANPADRSERMLVSEANVDDLDPRLWPQIISDLLAAGAADACLSPIVMKKGRPAHTLSVLSSADRTEALERLMLTHTSTIGVRRHTVDRTILDRETTTVEVLNCAVRVKLSRMDGDVVNVAPEYDDVAMVAAQNAVSAKWVLGEAIAAARDLWCRPSMKRSR